MNLPALYESPVAVPQLMTEAGDAYRYSEEKITVKYLIVLLRRRREAFFLTLAICVLSALLWTTAQPRTYFATADVVMITKPTKFVPHESDDGPVTPVRSEEVETQVQLITSRKMAEQVLDSIGLLNDHDFVLDVAAPRTSLDNLLVSMGFDRVDDAILEDLQPVAVREKAVTYLLRHLNVTRIGESYSLRISYSDSNAQRTALIANSFAHFYTTDDVREMEKVNTTAVRDLKGRVDELRRSANEAFAAVQSYRIRNRLLGSAETALTEQEISSYNQQVAQARAEAARDAAAFSSARQQFRNGGANNVGEATSSPVTTSLRAQRAQLVIRERDLSERYFDGNADLITVRQQIADIDRQIAAEVTRVIQSLETVAHTSSQRLASLLSSRTGAQSQWRTDNSALVELSDLEKRAEATQGLYQSYLQRYNSIVAGSGSQQPTARLVSVANVPIRPISPVLSLNLTMGLVVGVLMGAFVAIASELSYRGFTTLDDIENRLGFRTLGFIPAHRSIAVHSASPLETVSDHPNGAFAEAIRNVIVSIRQSGSRQGKVIAITSALPGEGKSTIASCLARSLALANERIIVVDCDVIRAQLSKQFGFHEVSHGLYEALHSEDRELIHYGDGVSTLRILPVTQKFKRGERVTEQGRFHKVIARLREDFDIVVLDCPPILPIAEAREIISQADSVVFVVHWRKTIDRVVKAALRQLPARSAKGAGIVLNRVDMKKQVRFGGGDASSFYKNYCGYYS